MMVAIIGSRGLHLESFENICRRVNGNSIVRCAPLKRNPRIMGYANGIISFRDGQPRGTGYVIRRCEKRGKNYGLFSMMLSASGAEAPAKNSRKRLTVCGCENAYKPAADYLRL